MSTLICPNLLSFDVCLRRGYRLGPGRLARSFSGFLGMVCSTPILLLDPYDFFDSLWKSRQSTILYYLSDCSFGCDSETKDPILSASFGLTGSLSSPPPVFSHFSFPSFRTFFPSLNVPDDSLRFSIAAGLCASPSFLSLAYEAFPLNIMLLVLRSVGLTVLP